MVITIYLKEIWGKMAGAMLRQHIESQIGETKTDIIGLSLANLTRLDVAGARVGIAALARDNRQHIGFYLIDIADSDIVENLDSAALASEQPLNVLFNGTWQTIGPKVPIGNKEVYSYLMSNGTALTVDVATELGLKIPNASNKLRDLYRDGYLLREERASGTGGIEHVYKAILPAKE